MRRVAIGKRKLLFEIKKRKVNKKLLKISLLEEQEPSVNSADRTKVVQV